jgi:hypothetical protein
LICESQMPASNNGLIADKYRCVRTKPDPSSEMQYHRRGQGFGLLKSQSTLYVLWSWRFTFEKWLGKTNRRCKTFLRFMPRHFERFKPLKARTKHIATSPTNIQRLALKATILGAFRRCVSPLLPNTLQKTESTQVRQREDESLSPLFKEISKSLSGGYINAERRYSSVLNNGFTTRFLSFAKVAAMLEQKDVARLFSNT